MLSEKGEKEKVWKDERATPRKRAIFGSAFLGIEETLTAVNNFVTLCFVRRSRPIVLSFSVPGEYRVFLRTNRSFFHPSRGEYSQVKSRR